MLRALEPTSAQPHNTGIPESRKEAGDDNSAGQATEQTQLGGSSNNSKADAGSLLSNSERLYLMGRLELSGNPNYRRVLECRIRKKIERKGRELAQTVKFASYSPQMRNWIDHYGITVLLKRPTEIENLEIGSFGQNKVRSPGFGPGLPAWRADVLDQTGRRPH